MRAGFQFDGESPYGCRYDKLNYKIFKCIATDLFIRLLSRWNVHRTYEVPQRDLAFYRSELDLLDRDIVVWRPYLDLPPGLPEVCRFGHHVGRARVSLICFEIAEMHVPDRVMRQFGYHQHIPEPVERYERGEVGRSFRKRNWGDLQESYIQQWNARMMLIQEPRPETTTMDDYWRWYWQITRRWIIQRVEHPLAYAPSSVFEREMVYFS